jgi:glycosyltransferase involved in cell wall biosynthesis
LLHHHDLAWQREHLAHLPGPRDAPEWRHVTINELSRKQLHERGIEASTIYNTFDCSPILGERAATRKSLHQGEKRLAVLPTRAIARKNVAGALALSEELDATLWILGPVEDGYDDDFAALVHAAHVRVRHMMPEGLTLADAYASADVVVMASTWEGFGNPVLESVTHRRPLALNPYPVAQEITEFGFHFFDIRDTLGIMRFIESPDEDVFEHNLALARTHFNEQDLPARLEAVMSRLS